MTHMDNNFVLLQLYAFNGRYTPQLDWERDNDYAVAQFGDGADVAVFITHLQNTGALQEDLRQRGIQYKAADIQQKPGIVPTTVKIPLEILRQQVLAYLVALQQPQEAQQEEPATRTETQPVSTYA